MAMYAGGWLLLSLVTVALSRECPCELEFSHDAGIVAYLGQFAKNEMERCCYNHGPDFSAWGKEACPQSFKEVYVEAKKADVEKIGQSILITDKFVMKMAAPHEVDSIDAILAKMSQNDGTMESLIAPICRRIRVTSGSDSVTVTISLKMQIKHAHMFPESLLFDLKGNYAFRSRNADPGSNVKRDGDFWRKFPNGVHISESSLEDMSNKIVTDTGILNESGNMGYSLLLQMVELCDHHIQYCAPQYNVDALRSKHPFQLGKFHKTCSRLRAGHRARPVYANDQKEFMYYYHGAWRIGKDIYQNDTTLFMESDTACPSASVAWHSSAEGQFKEVPVQMNQEDTRLDFHDKTAIKQANPHVPMAFATASSKEGRKTYAISYALIDVFTHENQKGSAPRHYANELMGLFTEAACRQDDIDPLDSSPYRARFLMMWNHRLTDAPCLAKTAYFTYFTRTDKLQATEDCPEGAAHVCEASWLKSLTLGVTCFVLFFGCAIARCARPRSSSTTKTVPCDLSIDVPHKKSSGAVDVSGLEHVAEEAKAFDASQKETCEKDEEQEPQAHEEPMKGEEANQALDAFEKETRENEEEEQRRREEQEPQAHEEPTKGEEANQTLDARDREEEKLRQEEQTVHLRKLKWRWAENKVFGMKFTKSSRNERWNMPADRAGLVKELEQKIEGLGAAAKGYKTRAVEFADVEYPEQRKSFANSTEALEWLRQQTNM